MIQREGSNPVDKKKKGKKHQNQPMTSLALLRSKTALKAIQGAYDKGTQSEAEMIQVGVSMYACVRVHVCGRVCDYLHMLCSLPLLAHDYLHMLCSLPLLRSWWSEPRCACSDYAASTSSPARPSSCGAASSPV